MEKYLQSSYPFFTKMNTTSAEIVRSGIDGDLKSSEDVKRLSTAPKEIENLEEKISLFIEVCNDLGLDFKYGSVIKRSVVAKVLTGQKVKPTLDIPDEFYSIKQAIEADSEGINKEKILSIVKKPEQKLGLKGSSNNGQIIVTKLDTTGDEIEDVEAILFGGD
jgi:hypothetical protein